MLSCFQPTFCFLLATFCQLFLDIACYACEKSNKNPLNIKQESDWILIPDSGLSQLDSDTLGETLPEKLLIFLCTAFQTYVHLCGRMSKVYGKSLGMSPYISLKISLISLISPISPILKEPNKKRVPDIIMTSGTQLWKKRRPPTLPHCIAVPSAQAGLTSLFGMGRGGTPPQ